MIEIYALERLIQRSSFHAGVEFIKNSDNSKKNTLIKYIKKHHYTSETEAEIRLIFKERNPQSPIDSKSLFDWYLQNHAGIFNNNINLNQPNQPYALT